MAFFLVGAAVHIVCGMFPKSIDVMPDELRYLGIARSLFEGDGLIMHGEASSFQKILYPLSLFPALLFQNPQDQVRAIGILNSLYVCSAVFPVTLIAKRLLRNPVAIVSCLAFTMILPDLMYSMTFMSESVFVPLALWLTYLCWRCFDAEKGSECVLAFTSGLLCYAVYLCKEVAWMFAIAFLAWYITATIRKRRSWQDSVMACGLFLIGFLSPFVLLKLTLFSGMMNSYSQFTFDILLSPYTVLFGFYALATDTAYFIIGFGVFPVLYLLCIYRYMPRSERNLAFFCLVSLLVGLICVVFTISMREDVGHVALRQHLRYVTPLFLPLLMLFIQQVARFDPTMLRRNPHRRAFAIGVIVAFCLLAIGFFGTANLRQGFDNSQFHFMRWLLEQGSPLAQEYHDTWGWQMSAISPDDGDLLVIEPLNWLCRFLVIAFTLLGSWFLTKPSERTRLRAGGVICAVIAAMMVANTICAYQYNRNAYGADQADVIEICAIDAQLAAVDDPSRVVIVLDDGNTKNNNLVDTYIQDGAGNYRYLKPDEALALLNADIELAGMPIPEPVEYLLVNVKQGIHVISDNVEIIGGSGGSAEGRYILYRATDDSPIKVLIDD